MYDSINKSKNVSCASILRNLARNAIHCINLLSRSKGVGTFGLLLQEQAQDSVRTKVRLLACPWEID